MAISSDVSNKVFKKFFLPNIHCKLNLRKIIIFILTSFVQYIDDISKISAWLRLQSFQEQLSSLCSPLHKSKGHSSLLCHFLQIKAKHSVKKEMLRHYFKQFLNESKNSKRNGRFDHFRTKRRWRN